MANKIDWSKPIEYLDGSPARFLGRTDADRWASVTPKGGPMRDAGNHYRDDGTHVYNYADPVRNVAPKIADSYAVVMTNGANKTAIFSEKKDAEQQATNWINTGAQHVYIYRLIGIAEAPPKPAPVFTYAD